MKNRENFVKDILYIIKYLRIDKIVFFWPMIKIVVFFIYLEQLILMDADKQKIAFIYYSSSIFAYFELDKVGLIT